MQDTILTVGALTEQLRKNLEARFPFVWVRGEVTNLSRPGSGHLYFTLKDADAQLQCVWFKQQQRRQDQHQTVDPMTGEVFETPRPSPLSLLSNGAELLCAGRIGVYAPRGQYQLIVDLVQPSGQGLLAQAFEERKRKLAAAGFFDAERKRPLPPHPQRVALITSPHGAAIHDFMELAGKRGWGAEIQLFPALMQGDEAAGQIVRAMQAAVDAGWAELIVLIRGGGSLEDLWAFNEEELAQAIFHCPLPVLAGIGHEVDVTLADMTADVRAATPSHAAQLLWPLRSELWQRLDEAETALNRAADRHLRQLEGRCAEYAKALRWFSPARHQERLGLNLDALEKGLHKAVSRWLLLKENSLREAEQARRTAFGPEKLSMQAARLDFLHAALNAVLPRSMGRRAEQLAALEKALCDAGHVWLERKYFALDKSKLALEGRDPLSPLNRGYALVQDARGRILRSVQASHAGQSIAVRLADGLLDATVTAVQHKPQTALDES